MTDLFAARSQMATSLGFHIIFAVIGVALPVLMIAAESCWLWTDNPLYLILAKRWATGAAVLFAVGAVSGTVLSFEMGLLWPRFMGFAGAAIGMPFSLEGFAFFTEAIFLGIYLYGWKRVNRLAHLFAGFIVALSGLISALFVTLVNGWMNTPTGFRLVNGSLTEIDVWRAMANPAGVPEGIHMALASYVAAGFGTAGIHSFLMLRGHRRDFHRVAIRIALGVATLASLAQFVSGDVLARVTARYQPTKLAAMEGHFHTERGAPLRIGGLPDMKTRETPYAIKIPYGLSLLAFHSPNAIVDGLDQTPREDWPNVPVVHMAFQVMVGAGSLLATFALIAMFLRWRRPDLLLNRQFLFATVAISPLGFVALEAGWVVTEVGRQPWIAYHLMRTSEAVTSMPGIQYSLFLFTVIYIILAIVVLWLMRYHVIATPDDAEIASVSIEQRLEKAHA